MNCLLWSAVLLLIVGPVISWAPLLLSSSSSRASFWIAAKAAPNKLQPSSSLLFFSPNNNDKNENNNNEEKAVDNEIGLNELHTMLRDAVAVEDYVEAGRISNIILHRLHPVDNVNDQEWASRRRRMSWKGLGAAPWLSSRLDSLNYTFPTTIQINAMEAVNAILNSTDEMLKSTSLEERVDLSTTRDMGIVISGTTGSGKSLAYMVPLLSTLSDSLFTRQRIRVGAEQMVGDTTGDLLDRIALVTSPVVRSSNSKVSTTRPRPRNPIATGASISTLGKSGTDVKSPLALVVVPTRELGVQTAMLLYQLVGGNIKGSPTEFSGKANMFKYKGPKGVRIGCVLDDEEATFGLKLQTDVAITTPKYLGKLLDDGDVDPSKLRVVIYDEADLALEQTNAKDLQTLFNDDPDAREYSRLTYLVGASVTEALGNLAVASRVLPQGQSFIATATRFAPLLDSSNDDENIANNDNNSKENAAAQIVGKQPKTASLKDLNLCLYPGLKHERAVVTGEKGLLALTRLLRKELMKYDKSLQDSTTTTTTTTTTTKSQRPRVVVFFPDEIQAKAAIEPLRDALWGEHRLCVLLPETGQSPLTIMDQFKRNETTVMLATPNSVRGLDFPALTHVYSLFVPMDDPREYVHLAGRVGRVGQLGSVLGDGGHVISILRQEDGEADKMDILAETLGFTFTDINNAGNLMDDFDAFPKTSDGSINTDEADVEAMRRYLEDTMTLLKVDNSGGDDRISAEPMRAERTEIDVPSRPFDDDDDEEEDDEDEDEDEESYE